MKAYKFILGAALCLSTVSCKVLFDGDGDKNDPPPPICMTSDTDELKTSCTPRPYDLEKTPTKVEFFNGGWYGPSPNFKLNITIVRDKNKITASVETPQCKVSASVRESAYVFLHELTLDVPTRIDDIQMVDGGDEVITITDKDGSESLYLKTGDHSYKKPVVKNASDAEAIRKQINKIADAVLVACPKTDATYRVWLKENVSSAGSVDADAMVPHPRYDITVQDLRVTLEKNSVHILGYRTIVGRDNSICTTRIDKRVTSTTAWKAAISAIGIDRSDVICARALGASAEDWRIVFPNFPKQLSLYKESGKVDSGFFGCWNANRVENYDKFDAQLNAVLKAQPPTPCMIVD